MHICQMKQRDLTFTVEFQQIILGQTLLCGRPGEIWHGRKIRGAHGGQLKKFTS